MVASVGPTGEFLEPLGPVSDTEMYDAFVEQVKALEPGGADAVVVETMTAVEEADACGAGGAGEHRTWS